MIILGTNSIKETGFNVANSLRFYSDTYLTATFGSAPTLATKNTISLWFKRSELGTLQQLYAANSNAASVVINTNDTIAFYTNSGQLLSPKVYRDTSAWMHFVFAFDSTQGTAANRFKVYINGIEETSFNNTAYPAQDEASQLGANGTTIEIGTRSNHDRIFEGYQAETAFVDGQALDATSFGEFDEDSGIWKPINISGLTFGNNGFYLEYKQSGTGTNSSGIGADTSGNDFHFAVTGFTAQDQSTDTCTNNFATLNPLNSSSNDSHTPPTYSEGNLQSASPSSGGGYVGSSTIGVTNGKWFWEFKKSGGSATNIYNGIGNEVGTAEIARNSAVGVYYGNQVFYRPDGTKQIITNGSNANSSYGASWTTNDIIGIALDLDSGTNTVTFYKNGASQGAINLPVNTDTWFFIAACGTDTVDTWQLNFGSPPYAISSGNADGNGYGNFEYAVPSGYYSLNSKNLSEYG